jgi:2-succinyl-5-enolpyruvyl-6-hydroxy-3-cyclohexene-1-carboxylate synthase
MFRGIILQNQLETSCQQLVRDTLDNLAAIGCLDISLCPGARNALFVQQLSEDSRFNVYSWPEERSAAFYALGLAKASGRPSAVITTSGTAVGELLPAVMEAYYSGLPLLSLTADRPKRYRGTGAPQSAEQNGIFGCYANPCIDLAAGESCYLEQIWDRKGPAHLNICLEDPRGSSLPTQVASWSVLSSGDASQQFNAFLQNSSCPLIVVGALTADQRVSVAAFLRALAAPVYLEALSGLREDKSLEHIRLHCVEHLWQRAALNEYPIDAVLRLGSIPTCRLWRDLDDRMTGCSVLSIDSMPLPGSVRSTIIHAPAGKFLSQQTIPKARHLATALLQADYHYWLGRQLLFRQLPRAEPSMMHALSCLVPSAELVYLGNSLPIREWDMAASYTHAHEHTAANRGLNGIDGQLSTFLGMCQPQQRAWGIFGDLTTLYDLAAPWILQARSDLKPIFVVFNNSGGQIFARIFQEKLFLNDHTLSFAPLAQMWGLSYANWQLIPGSLPDMCEEGAALIEVIPDAASTADFWMRDRILAGI